MKTAIRALAKSPDLMIVDSRELFKLLTQLEYFSWLAKLVTMAIWPG